MDDSTLRIKAVELAIEAFSNTDAYVDGDYTSQNVTAFLLKLADDIYNFLKGNENV
jgi:hypothetical protein